MKIGVFSTFMSPNATPQMIRDFGKRAEGMGLDSIWMGEHVVLFDKNTFGYPGSKDGRIPVPPGGGMLDVTATFGFLAAATSKLRSAPASPSCRNATRSTPPRKLHPRLAERRPHRFRHRRRLEQGGSRGLRLSVGGSRRALRRVPRGDAPPVDRAGGRLQGQVGEVRDRAAGSQADPEAARPDHRRRLRRSRPSAAPCSSAPAGTASTSIRRGTKEMLDKLDAAFAKAGKKRGTIPRSSSRRRCRWRWTRCRPMPSWAWTGWS